MKLCQLVMTDEAFHHKFGKIWADRTIPKLSPEEHNLVEDWAAQCFQTLLFNLINPEQMKPVYASVGIDWEEAQSALIMEAFGDDAAPRADEAIDQYFPRADQDAAQCRHHHRPHAQPIYAMYVDMDELKNEGDAHGRRRHRRGGHPLPADRSISVMSTKGKSLLAAE